MENDRPGHRDSQPLGQSRSCNGTLEAWAEGAVFPDPYVEMITDTVSYGAIGSFNHDDNGLIYDDEGAYHRCGVPFRFSVDRITPQRSRHPFPPHDDRWQRLRPGRSQRALYVCIALLF